MRDGYVAAPEEAMLGINAIAAPIFDDKDAATASLAVVGSIQFLPPKADAATVSALKAAAHQISRKLGHGRLEAVGDVHLSRRKTA